MANTYINHGSSCNFSPISWNVDSCASILTSVCFADIALFRIVGIMIYYAIMLIMMLFGDGVNVICDYEHVLSLVDTAGNQQ